MSKKVIFILIFCILFFIGGFIIPCLRLFGDFPVRIPPVSGQVVNAVTQEPIPGIDVNRHAFGQQGWSQPDLRYENCVTDSKGYFHFSSADVKGGHPFLGYFLWANMKFIPDAVSHWPEPVVSNPKFFNARIEFFPSTCAKGWNAPCLSFRQTTNIKIDLIPVLDTPEKCKLIHDKYLQELCRQHNTYEAALRNINTVEDVQRAKNLCNSIDNGGCGSQSCLYQIPLNAARDEAAHMATEPFERVFVLDNLGNFSVSGKPIISVKNVYENYIVYHVSYGINPTRNHDVAGVTVTQFGDLKSATKNLSYVPEILRGYKKDNQNVKEGFVTINGQQIKTYEDPWYYAAYWISGNKLIKIVFYNSRYYEGYADRDSAKKLIVGQSERNELIIKYLTKYPSAS